ncbi:MAG: hypothetical protein ACI97X_002318 [Oceanospirillaceae bacterium]|jgi:hypothetical protein
MLQNYNGKEHHLKVNRLIIHDCVPMSWNLSTQIGNRKVELRLARVGGIHCLFATPQLMRALSLRINHDCRRDAVSSHGMTFANIKSQIELSILWHPSDPFFQQGLDSTVFVLMRH